MLYVEKSQKVIKGQPLSFYIKKGKQVIELRVNHLSNLKQVPFGSVEHESWQELTEEHIVALQEDTKEVGFTKAVKRLVATFEESEILHHPKSGFVLVNDYLDTLEIMLGESTHDKAKQPYDFYNLNVSSIALVKDPGTLEKLTETLAKTMTREIIEARGKAWEVK